MVSKNQKSPVFELFDTTLAATMPDLIGLWTTKSETSDTEIAFALNAETSENVPLWRANFPSDFSQATLHLTHSQEALIRYQQALSAASERVHILINSIGSEHNLAFSHSSMETELEQPERELIASLQAIQMPASVTSFDVGEAIAPSVAQKKITGFSQQIYYKFQSFIEKLLQVITNLAWVETQVEGKTLARTAIGKLGGIDSIWQTGLSATQINLHQRTLALTLNSRNALLQGFSKAVQIALKLSVLLSVPGGQLLLLPAAWQFIEQVTTQSTGGLNP